MIRTAIINGYFLTLDSNMPSIFKGDMVIEDNHIASFHSALNAQQLEACNEVIDAKLRRLYMPGLINTHSHAAMSLLRGIADDVELNQWFSMIWPIEEKMTKKDVKWGTLLAISEMLKGGTTCFADMYDNMDEVAKCVETSGIRASLSRGIIGLCSETVLEQKLTESFQFAKDWNGRADGRITTMISPHSPYTCPPPVIKKIMEIAHDLDLPIHIHLAETKKEVTDCFTEYKMSPVDYLEANEVFSRPCLAAHAVHLSDLDINKLAQRSIHISHNPSSNLKLASGIARIPALLKANILVSLGTDSAASNNNLDLFSEARLAALLHKGISCNSTAISFEDALKMLTINGAKSLWLEKLGQLSPGFKADFIALDIDQPHFYPHSNFRSHIIYSASAGDVADVWVNGKQLVRQRSLLTLDEEKIKHEANLAYQRLTS